MVLCTKLKIPYALPLVEILKSGKKIKAKTTLSYIIDIVAYRPGRSSKINEQSCWILSLIARLLVVKVAKSQGKFSISFNLKKNTKVSGHKLFCLHNCHNRTLELISTNFWWIHKTYFHPGGTLRQPHRIVPIKFFDIPGALRPALVILFSIKNTLWDLATFTFALISNQN